MKSFIQIRQELNESPYGDPYRTVQRTKDAMSSHTAAIKKHDTAMQSHINKANAAEKKGLNTKADNHREAANAHHLGKEDHDHAKSLLKKHHNSIFLMVLLGGLLFFCMFLFFLF